MGGDSNGNGMTLTGGATNSHGLSCVKAGTGDDIDGDFSTTANAAIATSVLADTTVLPDGTWDVGKILKIIVSAAAGDVKDRGAGGYDVYSPDDGTTIMQIRKKTHY